MKHIKTVFGNFILLSVLIALLGFPITFMGIARFTNLPVLGVSDTNEDYVVPEKEYVKLPATRPGFIKEENLQHLDIKFPKSDETTPEYTIQTTEELTY